MPSETTQPTEKASRISFARVIRLRSGTDNMRATVATTKKWMFWLFHDAIGVSNPVT